MAAASSSSSSARPARRLEIDSDSWQPNPEKVNGTRARDFVRLTELQVKLKQLCASLLHFTRRDFAALAETAPEHAADCEALGGKELADSIRSLEPRLVRLAERIQTSEQLRIVFLGPVKAGKSTLINILLAAQFGEGCYEELLPVNYTAATNCIWKVESCDGDTAEVRLEGELLQQWSADTADATALAEARRDIATFLEDNLDRHARPENRREVLVRLPLAMLDPFGCHYCLVDTPGYTESAEYETLVKKYLQDHSHIACMVCPLDQGTAVPQATRNMLDGSFSKTLWVLTRYDVLLSQKAKRGQDRRNAVDAAVQKFTQEIKDVDAHARVFKHAAQLLMPAEERLLKVESFLKVEEAVCWLEDIRSHVKESFLLIQQEQLILSSQSRQCVDIASELLQEYTRLKDGTQGKLAASDHYVHELQIGAEDASKCLGREIRQEVENVKTSELDRLCCEVAAEVRSGRGHFLVQQNYFESLLAKLVPKMEQELQNRIDAAMERARNRLLEVVLKLVRDAGVFCGDRGESASPLSMAAPDSKHLRGKYPGESLAVLTLVSGGAGAVALTEGGGAVLMSALGLRVGAAAVAGWVGVAVVSFATMGWVIKSLSDVQPVWSYQGVEQSVVEMLRGANQWGILAEASCGRADAHLLSCAAHFRCAFSKAILNRGTPRDVLVTIFPDLPLFEAIHAELEGACSDIREFVDAQDLAARAPDDLVACAEAAKQSSWDRVIDATSAYVGPNARTDSVPGMDLAMLYQLRCEALSRAGMLGEARHSASIFRRVFPQLSLPLVYSIAAGIVFDFRAGSLDADGTLREVRGLVTRLKDDLLCREVPRLVEIWLLAVGASFLGDAGHAELSPRLGDAIAFFMTVQMKQRPSWQAVVDRKIRERTAEDRRTRAISLGNELAGDVLMFFQSGTMCETEPPQGEQERALYQEIHQEYRHECDIYAVGVVNSIHLLLGALPPAQVDVNGVGPLVVESVLAQVAQQLTRPSPMPREVEVRIRTDLCPVDNGFVDDLADVWVCLLGDRLRGSDVHDPGAYRASASTE